MYIFLPLAWQKKNNTLLFLFYFLKRLVFKKNMGATASVNATSKKYKTNEPIEVKFHSVVKYDDGDERPFKGIKHI